jgi:hypothetical protein
MREGDSNVLREDETLARKTVKECRKMAEEDQQIIEGQVRTAKSVKILTRNTVEQRIETNHEKLIRSDLQEHNLDTYDDGTLSKKRFIISLQASLQWQEVVRKSKKRPLKGCRLDSPDNKCFKCFSSGHFKVQCTNLIKCFFCRKPGHVHYKCPQKSTGQKSIPSRQKIDKRSTKNSKIRRTMANNFYEERPAMTTVYF